MPDYKNSKIYKLYVGDLVYIGSTAQPRLSLRLGQHKTEYNKWVKDGKIYASSFELFKVGDPTIELIELFPCGSKDELRAHEGFHQRANPNCVNIRIEGRTPAEYYQANAQQLGEQKRAYYQANAQQLLEQKMVYYQANRQQIVEQKRAYYQANAKQLIKRQKAYCDANKEPYKEHIAERNKAYYQANTQQLVERQRVYRAAIKRTERLTLFIQKHILSI